MNEMQSADTERLLVQVRRWGLIFSIAFANKNIEN